MSDSRKGGKVRKREQHGDYFEDSRVSDEESGPNPDEVLRRMLEKPPAPRKKEKAITGK